MYFGGARGLTVAAQTDRRTHRGTNRKTQEGTDRLNGLEGEPRGQPADRERHTV